MHKKLQIANPIVKVRLVRRVIHVRVKTERIWASITTKVVQTALTANELLFIMGKNRGSFPHLISSLDLV